MLAQIPEIDTVNQVRPVKVPGGFIWGVNFKLSKPAEQNGYIVQMIRQVDQGENSTESVYNESVYWEAWEIWKGETTPPQSQTVAEFVAGNGGTTPSESSYHIPVNDIFYKQYKGGCRGVYTITGLVGFYHLNLPHDFIVGNTQTGAGQLLSTIYRPNFFEKSGLFRQITFRYDFTNNPASDIKDDSKSSINRESYVWDTRPLAKVFGM